MVGRTTVLKMELRSGAHKCVTYEIICRSPGW